MLKIKIFLYIRIESLFPFTIICSLKFSTTNNLISVGSCQGTTVSQYSYITSKSYIIGARTSSGPFCVYFKRVVSPPAALQVPTHINFFLFQSQPPGLLGVQAQLGGKEGPKPVCGELGYVFARLDWSSSYTKDGSTVFFLVQNFTLLQKIYGKINDLFEFFSKTWKKIQKLPDLYTSFKQVPKNI